MRWGLLGHGGCEDVGMWASDSFLQVTSTGINPTLPFPYLNSSNSLHYLFWAKLCPPQNLYVEVLTSSTLIPQNEPIFGDGDFDVVIVLK